MVGGLGSLARVAVDVGVLHAGGERRVQEHEIDAHPEAAMEHAGAVVPIGERLPLQGARLQVDQAEVDQSVELAALGALTWVAPMNACGSHTSASVGATLKSPHRASGSSPPSSCSTALRSACSHASL